jgi:NO-binding membrane sensor protein with MHYT domain
MRKLLLPMTAAVIGLGFARLYYLQMFAARWQKAALFEWGLVGYWSVLLSPLLFIGATGYFSLCQIGLKPFTRLVISTALALVLTAFALAADAIICVILFRLTCV